MLNAAAERLFGQSAQEAVGRLYPAVFGPSLADRMVGLFLRAMRAADPSAAHLLAVTLPDGRRATLRANAGPLRDSTGALLGVFFVADEPAAAGGATPGVPGDADLRQVLARYVGAAVADRIAEHPSFVGVGGVRQIVSVLHADVRGYTALAEALEPEEVSRLLLRYHGAAVAALAAEHATPDRYIGDAILALWNAPLPQEDHARLAIRGALAMRAATRALGLDLEYGIGVHTGEAVVGNLGSDHYLHYTAIGDTVNVAARLQSAALGGGIVCSAATLAAAGAGVRATALGALSVKGRKKPVEAFAVEALEA
jgi:class 3 adenylate cyclase